MAEGLQRPEGVNISKEWVRAEGVERSHVAAENIGEQRRMLGMKFYVTRLLYQIQATVGRCKIAVSNTSSWSWWCQYRWVMKEYSESNKWSKGRGNVKHESTMLQAKILKLGKLSRRPGYGGYCIKYKQLVVVMSILVGNERVLWNLINGVVRSEHDIM